MKDVVLVTEDEVTTAYNHFVWLYYPASGGKGHFFWAFLGLKRPPNQTPEFKWELTKQAAHNCRMLAGPHYRTVAKVMEINGHDWRKEV